MGGRTGAGCRGSGTDNVYVGSTVQCFGYFGPHPSNIPLSAWFNGQRRARCRRTPCTPSRHQMKIMGFRAKENFWSLSPLVADADIVGEAIEKICRPSPRLAYPKLALRVCQRWLERTEVRTVRRTSIGQKASRPWHIGSGLGSGQRQASGGGSIPTKRHQKRWSCLGLSTRPCHGKNCAW